MKKFLYVMICIFCVGLGFFLHVSYTAYTETENLQEIKNVRHECLQYSSSREECTDAGIVQVAQEILLNNQKDSQ